MGWSYRPSLVGLGAAIALGSLRQNEFFIFILEEFFAVAHYDQVSILFEPGSVLQGELWKIVAKYDAWFSPGDGSFLSVLVRDDEVLLCSEELLDHVELGPVFPIVEDCILCGVVPEIHAEHGVEVHVSAK